MSIVQMILVSIGGIAAYVGFVFVMSRVLIVAIGDNDDLSQGDSHE